MEVTAARLLIADDGGGPVSVQLLRPSQEKQNGRRFVALRNVGVQFTNCAVPDQVECSN